MEPFVVKNSIFIAPLTAISTYDKAEVSDELNYY
jgi:hypothetical protein